jgi:hypothetical protein
VKRLATRYQIVLGEHLEPVHGRAVQEDRLVVLDPEAEAKTEGRAGQHASLGFPEVSAIVARGSIQ